MTGFLVVVGRLACTSLFVGCHLQGFLLVFDFFLSVHHTLSLRWLYFIQK
jgi:hypothetical protein